MDTITPSITISTAAAAAAPPPRLPVFIDIERKGMIEKARSLGVSKNCIDTDKGVVCAKCREKLEWEKLESITLAHYIADYCLYCDNCSKKKEEKEKKINVVRRLSLDHTTISPSLLLSSSSSSSSSASSSSASPIPSKEKQERKRLTTSAPSSSSSSSAMMQSAPTRGIQQYQVVAVTTVPVVAYPLFCWIPFCKNGQT